MPANSNRILRMARSRQLVEHVFTGFPAILSAGTPVCVVGLEKLRNIHEMYTKLKARGNS